VKVLFSVGVWGKDYLRIFVDYSLASQLSSENIPKLSEQHELTYHIATTRAGAEWLRRHPMIARLSQYCWIDWDYFEDLGYDVGSVVVGMDGAKYNFVSILQNLALKKSLDYDALLLNYADFIWTDGSITRAVKSIADNVDLLLTFCLPVDRDSGLVRLKSFKSDQNGVLSLSPREGVRLAIECLNREAKLRYWNNPKFTSVPTYLLWKVEQEGIIIRAYHQTALALRALPNNSIYRNGIRYGSLDGHFTSSLAESCNFSFAANSDEIFVFSLYHAQTNTTLRGKVSREEALRDCLKRSISLTQRKFAEIPIEVRLDYSNTERWDDVSQDSLSTLNKIHESVPTAASFAQQLEYEEYPVTSGARQSNSFSYKIDFGGRLVIFLYRRLLLPVAYSPFGHFLRTILGHRNWRRVHLYLDDIVAAISRARRQHFANNTKQKNYAWGVRRVSRIVKSSYIRLKKIHKLILNPGSVRVIHPLTDGELLELYCAGNPEIIIKRVGSSTCVEVVPNLTISARAMGCFYAGVAVERLISNITDLKTLDWVLSIAEGLLREVIHIAPAWSEGHRALGRNLWFQGRFEEALACFADGEAALLIMAKIADWKPDAMVFLPRNFIHVIGLMGHIEWIVKYKILFGDARQYILLAPESEIINRVFLEYWKNHIRIVTDPDEIARLAIMEPAYSANWSWVMPAEEKGRTELVHAVFSHVEQRWHQENRQPLLRLEDSQVELLQIQKSAWGMSADDWYVCLHVRSGGFYAEGTGTAQDFRNTPIEDYYSTISLILAAGGWVVRMGNSSMPPLDKNRFGALAGRVVDYAHATERSAALDVALCASCRLFISTNSGLHAIAHAFGRPVCGVNFPINVGTPCFAEGVFIPQQYFSLKSGRPLSFEEILSSDLVYANHSFHFQRADIELRRNKPDDIVAVIREALNQDTSSVADVECGDRIKETLSKLNQKYDRRMCGRIGAKFAVLYANELLNVPTSV
jgi:putative glycosyltransferase (TIGR04372 family)